MTILLDMLKRIPGDEPPWLPVLATLYNPDVEFQVENGVLSSQERSRFLQHLDEPASGTLCLDWEPWEGTRPWYGQLVDRRTNPATRRA